MTKINRQFRKLTDRFAAKPQRTLARMGDGNGVVDVPGVSGAIYVRLQGQDMPVVVQNYRVAQRNNKLVWIGRDALNPWVNQVLGAYHYFGEADGSEVMPHAPSHLWGGSDPAWIDSRQILGLNAYAVGLIITVTAGAVMSSAGVVKIIQQTMDMASHIPANDARYVLLSISASGVLTATDGSITVISDLSLADIPPIPPGHTPVWAVRMYDGQTGVSMNFSDPDLVDLRHLARTVGADSFIVLESAGAYTSYPATSTGLTDALAASTSGDKVFMPAGTFTGDYTVPTVVGLSGVSALMTTIVGTVTLEAASYIEDIGIIKSAASASPIKAVVGPATATALITSCAIIATNTGTDNTSSAYAIELSGGTIEANKSYFRVSASDVDASAVVFYGTQAWAGVLTYCNLANLSDITDPVSANWMITNDSEISVYSVAWQDGYAPVRISYMDGDRLSLAGSAAMTFTGLADTPNSYAGFAGLPALVKGDETGLEFVEYATGVNIFAPSILLDTLVPAGGQASFTITVPAWAAQVDIILSGYSEYAGAASDPVIMSFNGDTTDANYRTAYITGGSSTSNGAQDNRQISGMATAATANMTSQHNISIANPTGTMRKTANVIFTRREGAATMFVTHRAMQWESGDAITSIVLTLDSGSDFAEGTRCTAIAYQNIYVPDIDGNEFPLITPAASTRNVIQPSGDYKALILKNNATQTANIFEHQSSAGALLLSVNASGNIVIRDGGTIGQAAGPLLTFNDTSNYLTIDGCSVGIGALPSAKLHILASSVLTSGDTYANLAVITADHGSASTANIYAGRYFAQHNSSFALGSLRGFLGTVVLNGTGLVSNVFGSMASVNSLISGGAATNAYCMYSSGSVGSGFSLTATNWYNNYLAAPGGLGTYTLTNQYGIYVEAVNKGATLNYAIYTNAGLVRLGDQLSVIGSADRIQSVVKGYSSQTANLQEWQSSAGAIYLQVQAAGHLQFGEAINILAGTTTGTKIGTATTQKIGFWNAAPIVQPAGATQAAPAAYATGAFGLDSNANMQALYDLVVAMRTALVNVGIMKGAA